MRILSLLILAFMFLSCHTISFEKKYYEDISGIKFPQQYTVIETYDNMETATTTILKIDSIALKDMVSKYHFDFLKYPFTNFFVGNTYLKKEKPGFEKKDALFYLSGRSSKNTWLYIIDFKRELLWAEIQYPDWGGTSP